MAETVQIGQLADPVEILEDASLGAPGTPSQATPEEAPRAMPEETPQEAPKASKQGGILLPVLTVLLILVGIGEAVFWGYFGLSTYAKSLARERYEQQQKALAEEQASKGVTGGSSYSPNLKVENGTVTWEREKWGYSRSGQPAGTSANTSASPRREDGLRLSRLSVINIPYTLAEMDTGGGLSSSEAGGSAPAST